LPQRHAFRLCLSCKKADRVQLCPHYGRHFIWEARSTGSHAVSSSSRNVVCRLAAATCLSRHSVLSDVVLCSTRHNPDAALTSLCPSSSSSHAHVSRYSRHDVHSRLRTGEDGTRRLIVILDPAIKMRRSETVKYSRTTAGTLSHGGNQSLVQHRLVLVVIVAVPLCV
jgi:hypothetical protein